MIKRTAIVSMLKTLDIETFENDGPTSIFFSFDGGKDAKTFTLSVQREFIIVTTGTFLFKRKYIICKNEL